MQRLLAVLFVAVLTASSARADDFGEEAARAKARALTPAVLSQDAATLWKEFDPGMRGALKDSASLAATLRTIVAMTGPLEKVLGEQVKSPRPGLWVYEASCKFEKQPEPWTMLFAFNPQGQVSGMFVRPAAGSKPKEYASPKLDYVTKTRLRLPFKGEWFVFWGGRTVDQNYHAATRDQRFAYDIVMMKDGLTHSGDGKKLTDYYCYGQPVLAPAAGVVVWAQDSLPDNAPGVMDREHATGNSVVLDHGNGEYSLIAHLQPGSLRFHVGDKVPADARIGLCGNSGNTSEPHVHFHLQDGPKPFEAEGLPAPFVDLMIDGRRVERAEPVKGQLVRRAP